MSSLESFWDTCLRTLPHVIKAHQHTCHTHAWVLIGRVTWSSEWPLMLPLGKPWARKPGACLLTVPPTAPAALPHALLCLPLFTLPPVCSACHCASLHVYRWTSLCQMSHQCPQLPPAQTCLYPPNSHSVVIPPRSLSVPLSYSCSSFRAQVDTGIKLENFPSAEESGLTS